MKSLSDLAAACIRCGFCLDSCPTFKLTGSELESPRGRIYLARSAEEGVVGWSEIQPHIDRCLGCLACEPACPSAVQYGEILELARSSLSEESPNAVRTMLVDAVTNPALMAISARLPGKRIPTPISKAISGSAAQATVPRVHNGRLPAIHDPLPEIRGEVYFLEGCAMKVLFPRAHECTRRLLRRVGYSIRSVEAGCCGSMHAHNGFLDDARERADALVAAMPDDLPVIVDSAGCGSTMKRYGELIAGGEAFAKRVFDASEFLLAQGLDRALAKTRSFEELVVTYHDACHLVHGQRIREAPRTILGSIPGLRLAELNEADMCCGSAGVYNITQPAMARELLDRKVANISATGAAIVVTGNPGCHAWIEQGMSEMPTGPTVLHTMEMVEAAFVGLATFSLSRTANTGGYPP